MKGFEKFKHDSNQDIEKKETEMKSLLDQLKELENEKKNMQNKQTKNISILFC